MGIAYAAGRTSRRGLYWVQLLAQPRDYPIFAGSPRFKHIAVRAAPATNGLAPSHRRGHLPRIPVHKPCNEGFHPSGRTGSVIARVHSGLVAFDDALVR